MFKKILGTIGSRAVTAVLAFAAWTLNAHYLGTEKVGTIGLIIFSVAIIQLFTNFVAGSALVYMTPRVGIYRLFIPAYIWTLFMTVLVTGGMVLLSRLFPVAGMIPEGYAIEVMFLALVMSFASVNYMLLLGLEKVNRYNLITLVQMILLFCILIYLLLGAGFHDVMAYYWAIFISYGFAMIASLLVLLPSFKKVPMTGLGSLIRDILRFGTWVQFANFFQTMNYRLSLKFTDHFCGRGAVGILNLGMQIAEGLWLVSRSLGTVQYSRLSNSTDFGYGVRLTLTMAKISWVVTTLFMAVLLVIPRSFFEILFSKDFGDIRLVIASLSVGIIALSVSMILSGFFSSINRPWHNTISSAIGLVFTIALGLILIKRMGIAGAGIAATVSYTSLTIYQLVVFSKMTRLTIRDFLLTKTEIVTLFRELKKTLS